MDVQVAVIDLAFLRTEEMASASVLPEEKGELVDHSLELLGYE